MSVALAIFDHSSHRGYLAVDSNSESGGLKFSNPAKAVQVGPFVVASAGYQPIKEFWVRPGARYCVDLPASFERPDEWVHAQRDRFRVWLKEAGHGDVKDGLFGVDFQLLILTPMGIFEICSALSVSLVAPFAGCDFSMAAIGAGREVAMGAASALLDVGGIALDDVAERAVKIACFHAVGCAEPVYVHPKAQT